MNNSIEIGSCSNKKALMGIIELQKLNLENSLKESDIKREGFVTVNYNFDILEAMNECANHIIAKQNGIVIGYALSLHSIWSKNRQTQYSLAFC